MFAIFDAVKGFFEFIIDIVTFVIGLFDDLVNVVKILGQTVLAIPSYLAFLPSTVIALFVSCLTVVVLYKVLGRS